MAIEVETAVRTYNDKEYLNVYLVIDGKRFEVIPFSRTAKEKVYFYKLLERSH